MGTLKKPAEPDKMSIRLWRIEGAAQGRFAIVALVLTIAMILVGALARLWLRT